MVSPDVPTPAPLYLSNQWPKSVEICLQEYWAYLFIHHYSAPRATRQLLDYCRRPSLQVCLTIPYLPCGKSLHRNLQWPLSNILRLHPYLLSKPGPATPVHRLPMNEARPFFPLMVIGRVLLWVLCSLSVYLLGCDLVFYGKKLFISDPDFQETRDDSLGMTACSALFCLQPLTELSPSIPSQHSLCS